MTEHPADPLDGPHPHGTGIRRDAPTLTGLPDDAPDELRATLAGGDLGHIPTDAEREADRGARREAEHDPQRDAGGAGEGPTRGR